jgi:hypothetical protein
MAKPTVTINTTPIIGYNNSTSEYIVLEVAEAFTNAPEAVLVLVMIVPPRLVNTVMATTIPIMPIITPST